jgi:hypothetical protein
MIQKFEYLGTKLSVEYVGWCQWVAPCCGLKYPVMDHAIQREVESLLKVSGDPAEYYDPDLVILINEEKEEEEGDEE